MRLTDKLKDLLADKLYFDTDILERLQSPVFDFGHGVCSGILNSIVNQLHIVETPGIVVTHPTDSYEDYRNMIKQYCKSHFNLYHVTFDNCKSFMRCIHSIDDFPHHRNEFTLIPRKDIDENNPIKLIQTQQIVQPPYSLKDTLKNIAKNSSEEDLEIIKLVAKENNISLRTFNGRKDVQRLSEYLDDEQIWTLIQDCYKHCQLGTIHRLSNKLKMFLDMFASAFYKIVGQRFETYWGKMSHLHRVAEDHLGNLTGCCIRALQKGMQWYKNFNKETEDSEYQADKHEAWCQLEKMITAFLTPRINALLSVNPD